MRFAAKRLHRLSVMWTVICFLQSAKAVIGLVPSVDIEADTPWSAYEPVRKSVFSSRMRLLAVVGLEGSGHHFFWAMEDENREIIHRAPKLIKTSAHLKKAFTTTARSEIRRAMKELAQLELTLSDPGKIISLKLNSYPFSGGSLKALQYVDLRLIAEVAEEEGLDLRVIYLQRPARDLLISNTVHRQFQDGLGGEEGTPDSRFYHYSEILFTDIAVVSSMLQELDEAFIVCHRYDKMTDDKQVHDITNFVSPSAEVADELASAILDTATQSAHPPEDLPFRDADITAERLQQKMDIFEANYCTS